MYQHQQNDNVVIENTLAVHVVTEFSAERRARSKPTYTARAVPTAQYATLLSGDLTPSPGDLVLARVDRVSSHKTIDTAEGRRIQIFPGDEIVVCYAPRYAPDQFEAVMPEDLGPCHLAAGGGVAAKVISTHSSIKPPTTLIPIGLIGDAQGRRLNIAQWALRPLEHELFMPPVIAVVGTSMNSGKTTSAAHLVRGLTACALKVGATKVTGTGSPRDVGLFEDAGAVKVLDFTDAGYASTAELPTDDIVNIFSLLVRHLANASVDVIVIEVADGLLQTETAGLITSEVFKSQVDAVLFAAGEAMGAMAGVEWLQARGLPVKGMTGLVTASPLASAEAQKIVKLPVLTLKDLAEPESLESFSLISEKLARMKK
jgi:dethiobiotin synthetase